MFYAKRTLCSVAFIQLITSCFGQVGGLKISADNPAEYEAGSKRFSASGNVEVEYQDILLQSEKISGERGSAQLKAEEKVRLTKEDFRVLGSSIDYNYAQRSFDIQEFRMGNKPIYLKGKRLSGDLNNIVVEGGTLYFAEPDPYSLNIHAETITILDQKEVKFEDATFYIGGVPFFPAPNFTQDIEAGSPWRLKAKLGYQENLGAYSQFKGLYRATPQLKIGTNFDLYSNRGILAGPIAEYEYSNGTDNTIFSDLNTGFIGDNGDVLERGLDVNGNPINRFRYFIEWRYKQYYQDNIDITGSLSWWSDSEVEREFREDLFDPNQQPDSFFEAVYRGEDYFLSAFTRLQPNEYQLIGQRVPEVRFDWLPHEFFNTGVYQRVEVNFAVLNERDPSAVNAFRQTNRANGYYGITRPTKVASWLTATPVAGFMATHYSRTLGARSSYTRVLGEVGIDLEAQIHGLWDIQDETWGINGLRHVLKPIVQYRYIPEAEVGADLVNPIDRLASVETYLNPIGLANARNIDDLFETNAIRVGVENRLQTRHPEYGSRDLAKLDLYQEFRFAKRPGENDYSDFFTDIALYPARWLEFNAYSRIDPEELTLRELRTRLNLIDGTKWSGYVGNDYLQAIDFVDGFGVPGTLTDIHQYVAGFTYRLNYRNALRAEWRADANLGDFTEQVYAWETRLGNSWDVEFQVGLNQGSSRDDEFQFRIRVDLLTF